MQEMQQSQLTTTFSSAWAGSVASVKEDVLEQIVDDFIQFEGYFTIHNVRFRPSEAHAEYVSRDDSVSSDVDVVGYHPAKQGRARAW